MYETKTVYVAYTNTDCTEGRGNDEPVAICELEITAMRKVRHMYVQGSDGPVRKVELIKVDGRWYAPPSAYTIIPPTQSDITAQGMLNSKRAAMAKAVAAGLSVEEINSLQNGMHI